MNTASFVLQACEAQLCKRIVFQDRYASKQVYQDEQTSVQSLQACYSCITYLIWYKSRLYAIASTLGVSSLPQPPKNGAKQETDTDGIEKPHAIVLRHSPVGCSILLEDCVKLDHKGLRILGVKLQGLGTLFRAAELVKKLVVLPAPPQHRR